RMLQITDRHKVEAPSPIPVEGSSLSELVEFFRRILYLEYALILTITVLAIGLGVLYVYLTPPSYTPRATMLIERGKVQSQLGSMLREMPLDVIEVESHVQLLKSETVARAVANKLHLTSDPEFVGPPVGLAGWIYRLSTKLLGGDNQH